MPDLQSSQTSILKHRHPNGPAAAHRYNGIVRAMDAIHESITDVASPVKPAVQWGRSHKPSALVSLTCIGIITLCPILVIFSSVALRDFQGSLVEAVASLITMTPWGFASRYCPSSSLEASVGYTAWIIVQGALYNYLPSKLNTGQLTPAGYLLQYYTNGLAAWIVTHIAFLSAVYLNSIDPAWITKNWAGLLIATNCYGFLLSCFVYIKAYLAPTHTEDRKFSGSIIYDFYMGVEFNPRFGKYWDFKLFHNGRPGIVAWTLIDLSFAALQHQIYGYITNSMIIVILLHALYVVDFFINEDWYLRTIDICHDHFGFYLGWGSAVWLPAMYTIQAQYLAYNPVNLSKSFAAAVVVTGLGGYVIFRSVNYQKDIVRRTKGECMIWGRQAEVLKCQYLTADGQPRESLLLCSGWWGISRHANYFGYLVLSYSMCAACGFSHILPWFYAIYMTIMLLHRCKRAEDSCAAKYGKQWEVYRERVRWTLIPGVY